jgi:hypothetical protein
MFCQRHLWDELSKRGSTPSGGTRSHTIQSGSPGPAVSRRHFIQAAAGMSLVAGVGSRGKIEAMENPSPSVVNPLGSPAPVPIPGGFNPRTVPALGPRFPDRLFHFSAGPQAEPSLIFNFRGDVAVLDITGTGTRTGLDPFTGTVTSRSTGLPFAVDARFMSGFYIGTDGTEHHGTFALY